MQKCKGVYAPSLLVHDMNGVLHLSLPDPQTITDICLLESLQFPFLYF